MKNLRLRYTKAVAIIHAIDIDTDTRVIVFGDPEMGGYEWGIERKGKVEEHSDVGYGNVPAALRDGLMTAWPPMDDGLTPHAAPSSTPDNDEATVFEKLWMKDENGAPCIPVVRYEVAEELEMRIRDQEAELRRERLAWKDACDRVHELEDAAESATGEKQYGFEKAQAVCILKVRDALLANDHDEAWHWLYTLDSKQIPHDPFKPWADLERLARADDTGPKP